jgi:fluoroacetyl-CoA thioesterase
MTTIPLGAKGQFTLVVQAEHLANRFKDSALPPVLATPVMIMVVENAALNAIKAYLEPGQSAVGTRVDIRHLAPTPVGARVVGEAEVTGSMAGMSSSPFVPQTIRRRSAPARMNA